MRQSYGETVDKLEENEIFVFGSNRADGFHGGGAAGYASFGIRGNVWRKYFYDQKEDGWKGKWNVKGIPEGLQHGTEGCSYAIPTVTHAGMKRSIPKEDIVISISLMYGCANRHPDWRFLVAGSANGSVPLNGYSHEEMAEMYRAASISIPDNVVFSDSYAKLIFGEQI